MSAFFSFRQVPACRPGLLLAIALVAASAIMPVRAEAPPTTSSAPQEPPKASLQARAQQEVAQDWLRITLEAQVSDTSRTNASITLNKQLDQAMKQARQLAGETIRVHSGNYQIWPATDDKGSITRWRGRGEIHLESADFDAVSELAAQLGDDMVMSALNFSVSPETRAQVENDLLEDAVSHFRNRARQLAQAFGYAGYRLDEVSLGGSGSQYAPVARQMADTAPALKAQAITIEGGTEVISLSVQGAVYLLDKQ